jgi:hypothetical protein
MATSNPPAISTILTDVIWIVRADNTPYSVYSRFASRDLYETWKYSRSSFPENRRHSLSILVTNNRLYLFMLLFLNIFRTPTHTPPRLLAASYRKLATVLAPFKTSLRLTPLRYVRP